MATAWPSQSAMNFDRFLERAPVIFLHCVPSGVAAGKSIAEAKNDGAYPKVGMRDSSKSLASIPPQEGTYSAVVPRDGVNRGMLLAAGSAGLATTTIADAHCDTLRFPCRQKTLPISRSGLTHASVEVRGGRFRRMRVLSFTIGPRDALGGRGTQRSRDHRTDAALSSRRPERAK
jgi:hypothetical protein